MSIVWEASDDGKSKSRNLLIKNQENSEIYSINFDKLYAQPLNIENVRNLIEQGKMAYEDSKYTIEK